MEKGVIYLIMSVTMAAGGYLPTLFGASGFGGWSILGTVAGGIIGIVIIYRVNT